MVDDVVLLETGALHALAAALLAAVQVGLRALGVARLGDGDHHFLAGDQVLIADLSVGRDDPAAPFVAVLLDDLLEFVVDDGALALRLGQDVFQVGDLHLDLGQVVDDALTFEGGKAPQLHVQDRLGLDVVDVEQLDQPLAGNVDGLRRADQRDHLIERVERLDQSAQNVGPLVGLAQPVSGAAHDHVELVLDVVADHLVEPEGPRYTVDDREHVGAEAGLQLGVLVEVVQHHLRNGVTLEFDDDPDADPVTALILDVGDTRELAVADLLGDRGDEVVVVDLIRQLGDDDSRATPRVLLDLHYAAHPNRAATRGVGVVYPLRPDDQAGGGEVGPLHAFGDCGQRGLFVGLVVLQAPVHRFCELAEIVWRDVGGHADGDAARTVGEQIWEPARQDGRLLHAPVVVRNEIDCLLVDFTQHLHREWRQPRFCVMADEAVGDEGVVGSVYSQAINRLHARIRH